VCQRVQTRFARARSAKHGAQGTIQILTEPDILQQVITDYRSYMPRLDQTIDRLASSRTVDRRLRVRIKDALRQQLGQFRVSREHQVKLI